MTTLDKFLALLPDTRGWVALGLFALAAYVLTLLAHDPKLADSQLFAGLATAIIVGGLIQGVVTFLFGGTKSGATMVETANLQAKAEADKAP